MFATKGKNRGHFRERVVYTGVFQNSKCRNNMLPINLKMYL